MTMVDNPEWAPTRTQETKGLVEKYGWLAGVVVLAKFTSFGNFEVVLGLGPAELGGYAPSIGY
jgi:hypothetical protein